MTTRSRDTSSCYVSWGPGWLAYDPTDASFWVATPPDCVVVFSAAGYITNSLPVGLDPFGVAVDNATGDVFVANTASDNVTVISPQTNLSIANITVGAAPTGIAYDSATNEVYVANSGSDNVSVISAATLRVVATVPVGAGPIGVAADLATGQVFVANNGSGNVSVISTTTHSVLTSVEAGSGPYGVAWDNTSDQIFVTNDGSDNVTVINGSGTTRSPRSRSYPRGSPSRASPTTPRRNYCGSAAGLGTW